MRKMILTAAIAAAAIPFVAAPASAQGRYERHARQDCRHDLRDADNRREYNREVRDCRHDIRQARNRDWRTYNRWDYNRYPPSAGGYYAENYYRDGRYYRERRLSRYDRIYRGRDGRYYCRRSDGTTGLIVGAALGGLLGNAIDDGRSSLLGTLIGAAAGGALGREVERGQIRCR